MGPKPLIAIALAIAFLLVVVAPAHAVVTVSIDPSAKRVKGGRAVNAIVTVLCDPGLETLEAHLTVSQDDQTITGTGGLGVIVCDATPHEYRVIVPAQQGRYHRGEAFASAFVLLLDPSTNTTQQGQASGTITIR